MEGVRPPRQAGMEKLVEPMRTARPLGLSADGKNLLIVTDDGVEFAVAADARLRAALRNDRPRLGQLEIDMDSELRPREIQARIRAGETIEQVATAAGIPVERIEPYAAPVIAEREHIANLAQTQPVRRPGETVAHRSLRAVVSERLLGHGVDIDTVTWDAWRMEDRRWLVKLSFVTDSAAREAIFTYDQTGRFSLPTNDDARWLLGTVQGTSADRRRRGEDPDAEPTIDLNDELALVRAIQPSADEPADNGIDIEDAYTPVELEEVDGVYELVPDVRTSMDVLYDMLASFDEDSVQIYAGLIRPPAPGSQA
ncbi:MAG: septation protein SepH, partial [Micropruina sp.]